MHLGEKAGRIEQESGPTLLIVLSRDYVKAVVNQERLDGCGRFLSGNLFINDPAELHFY